MKIKFCIAATAAGLCAAAAAVLHLRHRRKPKPEPVEDCFRAEWTRILKADARVFNGLFSGLLRIRTGSAKKPEKVLREWCQRTHYQFENQTADTLCQQQLLPLIESAHRDGLSKWANLLLEAAEAAGITRETARILVLTQTNAADYVEWDGEELYPDDTVEIITPAWYHGGKLLEQGQCRKIAA